MGANEEALERHPSLNPEKLNQLRAAVLGANDGIISVSAALVAVVGVFEPREIMLTGAAVLMAGALSMSAGEYLSVSAQVHHEDKASDFMTGPKAPWQAALASFAAFFAGGLPPAILALLTTNPYAIIAGALVLLLLSAALTARKEQRVRSTLRLLLVGAFALGISLLANLLLEKLNF